MTSNILRIAATFALVGVGVLALTCSIWLGAAL